MMTRERKILLALVTVLLIILTATTLSIRSNAKENDVLKASQKIEADYRNEIRDSLKEAGMKNPGITMTKITDDGVNVTYNVVIYVPAYKHYTEMEKEEIIRTLNDIEIGVYNASVTFSFA